VSVKALPKNARSDQASGNCGRDCVFLMARLLERECSLSDVDQFVIVANGGSTLADLANGAKRLGMEFRIVQCSPDEIDTLPLPAIALLEPTSYRQQHYVVLLDVQLSEMTFVDASTNRVHVATRKSVPQGFTGFFLVERVPLIGRSAHIVWIAIVMALLLIRHTRRWLGSNRSKPTAEGTAGRSLGYTMTIIVGACIATWSGCSTSDSAAPRERAAPLVKSLDVPERERDFGTVRGNVPQVAVFEFCNATDRAVRLSLGAPSCTCLSVQLEPPVELAPRATARLTLVLDTSKRRRGGRETGTVKLGVAGGRETHQFKATAVLEGMLPVETYVIRPRALEADGAPKLKVAVVTQQASTFVELVGLQVVSAEAGMPPAAPPNSQPADFIPLPELRFALEQAVKQPIRDLPGQDCVVHEFEIPVTAAHPTQSTRGKIEVTYRIGPDTAIDYIDCLAITDGRFR
jgi:hypothetical protein